MRGASRRRAATFVTDAALARGGRCADARADRCHKRSVSIGLVRVELLAEAGDDLDDLVEQVSA